jgi:uncharacterized protein
MAEIQFIEDLSSAKFDKALLSSVSAKLSKGMKVAVKLHMGEGKGMFSPELARRAVTVLKSLGCEPFLFDTPVVYPGPRHTKAGYEALAPLHGFSEVKIGCPVVICDEYVVMKTDHMDVEVAKVLAEADALLVLTHVKGHDCSGFGGSIKNLAMGCASPKSKGDQHSLGKPVVDDARCIACKACEKVCAFGAMKVGKKARVDLGSCVGCDNCVLACPHGALHCDVMFDTLLAEAALAALNPLKGKPVFYVNDARSITKHCDCFSDPGSPVAKDVGVFLGDDLAAIEQASLDVINKSEGRSLFKIMNHHDPYLSVKEAERLGLGRAEYLLRSI